MKRQMKLNDYEGFVEKFKPKKTTDDCMTPPAIYETVRDYACKRWSIDPEKVVRPFWPGEDYKAFDYSDGKVVIDNPPFSILSRICEDFLEEGIPFFLFAPSLTALSSSRTVMKVNHIICGCNIVYENGAIVPTSFITSYGLPNILESSPELTKLVNDKMREILNENKKELPRYEYPHSVATATMVQRYSKYGVDFSVRANEALYIRQLDAQKESKKEIYGGGLLLSERATARRALAERAAERAATGSGVIERWELSEREKELIKRL